MRHQPSISVTTPAQRRRSTASPTTSSSSTCRCQGLHALVPRGHRLRRAARQHHGHPAVPPVLRRRPGQRARLPREPPGPKDQFGNPYGGNMRITSQNELIFPCRPSGQQTARVSAFFDMGGVYQTGTSIKFYGPDGVTPKSYASRVQRHQALGRCRRAVAGAAGSVPVQLGMPLNAQHGDGVTTWGDPDRGLPVLGRATPSEGLASSAKRRAARRVLRDTRRFRRLRSRAGPPRIKQSYDGQVGSVKRLISSKVVVWAWQRATARRTAGLG